MILAGGRSSGSANMHRRACFGHAAAPYEIMLAKVWATPRRPIGAGVSLWLMVAWTPRGAPLPAPFRSSRGDNLYWRRRPRSESCSPPWAIDGAVWTALHPGGAPNDHSCLAENTPLESMQRGCTVHGAFPSTHFVRFGASDSLPRCRIQRRWLTSPRARIGALFFAVRFCDSEKP